MNIDPMQIAEGELTEEEEIYKENILDHYKNPHNSGTLTEYTVRHREFNPICGDKIELFVQIDENKVLEVKFTGTGCAISQAAMSMLTDKIKQKTVNELKLIKREDILEMLGIQIGVVRIKCALLCLKTLHKGLEGINNE